MFVGFLCLISPLCTMDNVAIYCRREPTQISGFRGVMLADTWRFALDACPSPPCPLITPDCVSRCETHTSCGTCTGDAACGWCDTTGTCSPGDGTGPDDGTCAAWEFDSCAGTCASQTACADCFDVDGCGWCEEDLSCRTVAAGSTCAADLWSTDTCPTPCYMYDRCDECLDHSQVIAGHRVEVDVGYEARPFSWHGEDSSVMPCFITTTPLFSYLLRALQCSYCVGSPFGCTHTSTGCTNPLIGDAGDCPVACEDLGSCEECMGYSCMYCPTLGQCISSQNYLQVSF